MPLELKHSFTPLLIPDWACAQKVETLLVTKATVLLKVGQPSNKFAKCRDSEIYVGEEICTWDKIRVFASIPASLTLLTCFSYEVTEVGICQRGLGGDASCGWQGPGRKQVET